MTVASFTYKAIVKIQKSITDSSFSIVIREIYFEDCLNPLNCQCAKDRWQLVDQMRSEGVGVEEARDDVIGYNLIHGWN
jgi:hypothetical protein